MIIIKNFIISIFILLVLFADLKVTVSPYIHWVAWIILVFPIIILSIYKKGLIKAPTLWLGIFIFIFGVLSTFFTGLNKETIVQLVKLGLVFMTLYYFVFYDDLKWSSVVKVINIAVIINIVCLIVGMLGISNLAQLMTADGRWGTIFAYPGSLVKIGVLGFYINIMAVLIFKKQEKIIPLIMLLMSLFIVFMDGSRTGMLTMMLTLPIIFGFYAVLNYRNKVKFIFLPTAFFVLLIGAIIVAAPFLKELRIGQNISNISQTESLLDGLERIDPARFSMYMEAINKIKESPFIGLGAFTTVGNQQDSAGMVVHNTYLQSWGDFGVIGFFGILLIYTGWLVLVPRLLRKVQINTDIKGNVSVCSSVLILTYFVLNGLFHPYSTELSEWILYIIPLKICYSFLKKN